ncbi:ATP-dependent Clp protease adaptor ClpS [Acetobacteraceae bacterium]|nr:ATP-dependent Clp protease adaptor ClpS [Acetobacteraceae bacterium]
MTNNMHADEPKTPRISGNAQAASASQEEGNRSSATSEDVKGVADAQSLKAKILGPQNLSMKKPPSLYRVILLNDDFTPEAFVLAVLQNCFGHGEEDSKALINEIQNKGSGVGGVYSYEVAETKMDQVSKSARKGRYPLQCTLERLNA